MNTGFGAGKDVDADRLLRSEETLAPSPGFEQRVMEAVWLEASRPEPLGFPWLPYLAGLASCGALLAAGAVAIVWSGPGLGPHLLALAAGSPQLRATLDAFGLTLAALAGSWLLTWSARRLVRA